MKETPFSAHSYETWKKGVAKTSDTQLSKA
jgi:hypothetical protein